MIKYCSFVDVLQLPQFQRKNEQWLLHPETDAIISEMLYPLGVEKTNRLTIQACKHRTNSGDVVVNYRYVFTERRDKAWLWSGKASLEARINDTKDSSLIGELSILADMYRQSRDNVLEICQAMEAVANQKNRKQIVSKTDFEEDMEAVVQKIKALQILQESIRGPLHADEDVLWDIKNAEEVLKADFLQLPEDNDNNEEENVND